MKAFFAGLALMLILAAGGIVGYAMLDQPSGRDTLSVHVDLDENHMTAEAD